MSRILSAPYLPAAARGIQKGVPLKFLLDGAAIDCLAHNISLVDRQFKARNFRCVAREGIEPLELLERGRHLARVLREYLPPRYSAAIKVLLASLTPPLEQTKDLGLSVFFYLPHVCFVAQYGLDRKGNQGRDPFEASMTAQYQLTRRFSAEFSIRHFLIEQQDRTLSRLEEWLSDPCPHVRRLCCEGTRPRLPWAVRIPQFIAEPQLTLPILHVLKDDQDLYVRRSVANHLGDIAKDHLELALSTCEGWLAGATKERKWLIRHALRYPAKKGDKRALRLRERAG